MLKDFNLITHPLSTMETQKINKYQTVFINKIMRMNVKMRKYKL